VKRPRVTEVAAWEFRRALDGHSWNPRRRWHERRAVLVELSSEDGVRGIGECWFDGDSTAPLLAFLERAVAPAVLGQDASAIEATVAACRSRSEVGNPTWVTAAAASGVDIALLDMRGRRTGLPVATLLGGCRAAVPVYASGGLYQDGKGPAELAQEMASYVAAGFKVLKMKVGGVSLEEDLARVDAVRLAVPASTLLLVDAVGTLGRETALEWAHTLARHGVWAIQAPVQAEDVEGWRALTRAGSLPVIGVETEWREEAFTDLVLDRRVSLLQFSVALCGGLSAAMRLVTLAEAHGLQSTPQCSSTAVAELASFHLAAACTGVWSVEYHMFHRHLYELLPESVTTVRSGHVLIPDAPGLGLRLPEAGLASVNGLTLSFRASW
jgi:L-alanine-DL-glutamate epimerase-like enolase superfamily enzyme